MPEKDLNADIFFEDADLPYEEDILRNPFSVKSWQRYIEHKRKGPKDALNLIYERALKELPGSYKLWYHYLRLRRNQMKGKCISDPGYEAVNNAFERGLVFMHKMPRIWLDYLQFLMSQGFITRLRKALDRALGALPVTQHNRVWPLYLKFVTKYDNMELTATRVYRRFVKLQPESMEEFVAYLLKSEQFDEAAVRLADIINDDDFVSKEGKSKHQLWNDLCDLICKHPENVRSLKVEPIIRQGIRKYTDQVGVLWNALADYYIRSGLFERARDVYEEAIQTVTTVRDFTQVFDTYAQFEESVIGKKMDTDKALTPEEDLDLELRLARLEDLMERRPLLLNSVLLRQNPHNVHEWVKRVSLCEGRPRDQINTFTEAVQTIDPKQATGRPHTLWVQFAKYYENADQVEDARIIFERAVKVEFKHVDDLASIWCEWAEMELRCQNFDGALKLMHRATAIPQRKVDFHDTSEPVQSRLYKSLKVWSMYADLEESFGTYKTCKAAYDRIIDLRIATPQIIINYGMYLEENKYFEEAFKAYEKGIALFKWPNVYDIWNTYLTKFINRYGGSKLERIRDLFEQCVENVPPKFAKALYLLYAKQEEEYGLARHAMAVYDRATRAVLPEEQYEMFNIYIRRAAEMYGITYTREIYEKAIEALPDNEAREMCLRFADLERKLGEIDRARAIYAHCSQMCDTRAHPKFWDTWKEFEVKHGNEDTIREMLRIRRSVQATFNTQVNFMSAQVLAAAQAGGSSDAPGDGMANLEAKARQLAEEAVKEKAAVASSERKGAGGAISFVRGDVTTEELGEMVEATKNPEEIDIDEDSGDEEHPVNEINIQQRAIPTEVYGSLGSEQEMEES